MKQVRIAAVQYQMKPITIFDQFADQAASYIRSAKDWDAHFVLFPEMFTLQLLSFFPRRDPQTTIRLLHEFTDRYIELFSGMAKENGLYIIGGTHMVKHEDDKMYNMAYFFHPDGSYETQPKVHLTPYEKSAWLVHGGDFFRVFDTHFGKVAILICYDIEFPEAAKIVSDLGAQIIFCPSCTDDEHGFHRVRFSCHARAIENQVYVVHTGTTGWLPNVQYMEGNYGEAAIIAPCDTPFPPKGIIAQGQPNIEKIIVGDVYPELLLQLPEKGSVRTVQDRRPDIYKKYIQY
jgi:predicted amidohydrolase